jgi:signal recognition particle receptor subunit beta
MVAYIFLVDSKKEETFEYTKYLLNKMIETYSIPCVVGITNIDSGNEKQFNDMRKLLGVPEEIAVLAVDPDSFKDVIKLVYNLKRTQPEEENKDV